jgi:phytanoyl-CoA hydroxylase
MSIFDLDHWNSNILFTDDANFSVEDYLRKTAAPEDFNLREKLEQWRDVGIVTFENCVDIAAIDDFLTDIVAINERRQSFEIEVEYKGQRYRLPDLPVPPLTDTGIKFNCLENISLAARRLSLNRFICRFLRHVFQDSPAVIQSLTFWRGSEQPAHLDYPWVCVQTKLSHLAASWIPLEDIHADSGPLAYYPGSHKQGVLKPFDWGDGSLTQLGSSPKTPNDFTVHLAEEIQRLNLKRQIFLPKKGDALIWHGNVLHEGTKVNDRERTRRSYVTHYTSRSAYPKEHMTPDVETNHRYTEMNGGYVFDHPWVVDSRELPSWNQG